jgi:hypothetical protein
MQPLLVGLAHRFGGSEVVANELFDSGAALWAGVEKGEAWAIFRELESLDTDRFDRVLRQQLSAQRLIDLDLDTVVQCESTAFPCSKAVAGLLDRTAAWTLRAWARWLPGLGGSSPSYLLQQLIRRPGSIRVAPSCLHVHLEPAGLDEILRMAGYLSESPAVSWLGNRTIRFTVGP